MPKIGIIAGGGNLPLAIGQNFINSGDNVTFNVTLKDTILTKIKERHHYDIKIFPNPGKDIAKHNTSEGSPPRIPNKSRRFLRGGPQPGRGIGC